MDFDFTDEQVMLRDVVREFLAGECPTPAVRSLMDDPTGYSPALWDRLRDQELLGITIPQQHGGQELGLIELAIVLEEMGRCAYPGPFFSTVVLAGSAIALGGDRGQISTYLPRIAQGQLKATLAVTEDQVAWRPEAIALRGQPRGGEYSLTGRKRFIPWAHVADLIVVAARTLDTADPRSGITLFAVPASAAGLTISANQGFDTTSRTSDLDLKDVRVGREAIVGELHRGWEVVEAVLERAAVGTAAEMLGASRRAMEMSVEYAKVREQFGQPIGAFQAVKHACAEMLVEVENSHASTYYAAWALEAGAPDASFAASVAKSYGGDASRKVCGSAIQVHGGIGFTWEYDLHLFFKRAKHLEAMYGDAEFHRARVLTSVLEPVGIKVTA